MEDTRTLTLQPGEIVLGSFKFEQQPHLGRAAQPFFFIVTTRALLVSGEKLFALRSPYYVMRILRTEIMRVRIRRLRSRSIRVIAILLILGGLYVGLTQILTQLHASGGDWTKVQDAMSHEVATALLTGAGLLLAARGRVAIIIETRDRVLVWRPPIVFDKRIRSSAAGSVASIISLLSSAGISLHDERLR